MLIRNLEDVKLHINTNATFEFTQFKPYAEGTQRNVINNLFGEAFVDALDAKLNDDDAALTALETKLVKYLQMAIVYIAYGENLASFMVAASNQGLHVIKTDSKLPLFRELRIEFSDIMCELGYSAIEVAAKLLYKNADADEFDAFQNSDEFLFLNQRFITTAAEFHRAYPIANSRRTYEAIKSAMDEVELFVLQPVLGQNYYELLLERILDDDLQTEDKALMPLIRKVVANLSVAIAAEKFRAKATSKGWVIISQESTGNEFSQNKIPVTDGQTNGVAASARLSGNGYLSTLKGYLFTNANSYPLYKASTAYTDQLQSTQPLNTTNNKGVIL